MLALMPYFASSLQPDCLPHYLQCQGSASVCSLAIWFCLVCHLSYTYVLCSLRLLAICPKFCFSPAWFPIKISSCICLYTKGIYGLPVFSIGLIAEVLSFPSPFIRFVFEKPALILSLQSRGSSQGNWDFFPFLGQRCSLNPSTSRSPQFSDCLLSFEYGQIRLYKRRTDSSQQKTDRFVSTKDGQLHLNKRWTYMPFCIFKYLLYRAC